MNGMMKSRKTFGKGFIKSSFFVLLLMLLSVNIVLADTEISDKALNSVFIRELSVPATFELTVTNNNLGFESYSIDTLLDIKISPKSLGSIAPGQTKTFTLEVVPGESVKESQDGNFAFEYFVKGINEGLIKDTLVVNIISFAKLLDLQLPPAIEAEDTELNLNFALTEDVKLDAKVSVSSELISEEFDLSLSEKSQTVSLDLTSLEDKKAGVYETTFAFNIDGETVVVTTLNTITAIISNNKITKGNQ